MIALDIAKNVSQAHGIDETRQPALWRRLRITNVLRPLARHLLALAGTGPCPTRRRWAHQIATLGHAVRLLPSQLAKPCPKSQKNDAACADAICEAAQRPTTRFVAIEI